MALVGVISTEALQAVLPRGKANPIAASAYTASARCRLQANLSSSPVPLRGASERLMPILMTATVTALGLLPLAIGSGEAGREIEGPMAIVILGGLLTSTALNLLVLPTLALRYGKFSRANPAV